MNVNELATLSEKFEVAKGTPEYDVWKADYTGPDNGVYHVDETGELLIHTGWHADQDGALQYPGLVK